MAQEPSTAQFAAMPQAVFDTGLADFVLSPALMATALHQFAKHPQIRASGREEPLDEVAAGDLEAILRLLRTRTNIDYGHYKRSTLLRRIQRRMGLRQIASMGEYVKLLQKDTAESTELAKDMLIGVSSFFRDAEGDLRRDGIYKLLKELREADNVRLQRARDHEERIRGGTYYVSEIAAPPHPDLPDTA